MIVWWNLILEETGILLTDLMGTVTFMYDVPMPFWIISENQANKAIYLFS